MELLIRFSFMQWICRKEHTKSSITGNAQFPIVLHAADTNKEKMPIRSLRSKILRPNGFFDIFGGEVRRPNCNLAYKAENNW